MVSEPPARRRKRKSQDAAIVEPSSTPAEALTGGSHPQANGAVGETDRRQKPSRPAEALAEAAAQSSGREGPSSQPADVRLSKKRR